MRHSTPVFIGVHKLPLLTQARVWAAQLRPLSAQRTSSHCMCDHTLSEWVRWVSAIKETEEVKEGQDWWTVEWSYSGYYKCSRQIEEKHRSIYTDSVEARSSIIATLSSTLLCTVLSIINVFEYTINTITQYGIAWLIVWLGMVRYSMFSTSLFPASCIYRKKKLFQSSNPRKDGLLEVLYGSNHIISSTAANCTAQHRAVLHCTVLHCNTFHSRFTILQWSSR